MSDDPIFDFIHSPPNSDGEIAELFAFVSVDEHGEGIIATILPGLGSTPLVTGKRSVAISMRPLALDAAKRAGKQVRLVRFTRAEIAEELP